MQHVRQIGALAVEIQRPEHGGQFRDSYLVHVEQRAQQAVDLVTLQPIAAAQHPLDLHQDSMRNEKALGKTGLCGGELCLIVRHDQPHDDIRIYRDHLERRSFMCQRRAASSRMAWFISSIETTGPSYLGLSRSNSA